MAKPCKCYSNTVIYKIVCKDSNVGDFYIGHTTDFKKRQYHHKDGLSRSNPHHNYKIYKCILKNGGWDNWKMSKLENYPCNNVDEAKIRETYWVEKLKPNLNVNRPISSDNVNIRIKK
jgi:hypothetical protein